MFHFSLAPLIFASPQLTSSLSLNLSRVHYVFIKIYLNTDFVELVLLEDNSEAVQIFVKGHLRLQTVIDIH